MARSTSTAMTPAGHAKQEKTANRIAEQLGAVDPAKSYRIGTPRLKEVLSDAFEQGAIHGTEGTSANYVRPEEIDHAIRATGNNSETRSMARALETDSDHRQEILREVFNTKLGSKAFDKVQDIVVRGDKIRDALKTAYAEGVRARAHVKAFVEKNPPLSSERGPAMTTAAWNKRYGAKKNE
jgi:hypothetical protein